MSYYVNCNINLSDRRLLGHKRVEQIEAAKQIVAISSLEKQRNMLKTLFTKLFSVSITCHFCSIGVTDLCLSFFIIFFVYPYVLCDAACIAK